MHHVVETLVLSDDDAVAIGVALGFDKPDAVGHLHRVGEVVVGLAILGAHHVGTIEFQGIGILG